MTRDIRIRSCQSNAVAIFNVLSGFVRKMRSPMLFFGFMIFVTVIYAVMVLGQPGNVTITSHPSGTDLFTKTVVRTLNGNNSTVVTSNATAILTVAQAANDTGNPLSPPTPVSNHSVFVDDSAVLYRLNKPELCFSQNETIDLLIMVVTAPNNTQARDAIRSTWGTIARKRTISLAFVLGLAEQDDVQTKLVQEDALYGDLIQGNFLDAYYNLTLKSVMILKWAHTYCSQARFVLKIDDDCFLNPYKLLAFLESEKAKKDLAVFGRVWRKVKPIRNKKDKWMVPKDVFPGTEFPDYTAGPSYVITRKAVEPLLMASGHVKRLDMEDIFVTGLCAVEAKVPRFHESGFNSDDGPGVCRSRNVISYHRVAPDFMFLLWWAVNDEKFVNCGSKEKSCLQSHTKLLVDIGDLMLTNLHL